MEFAISRPKMVRLPWNKNQTYRFNTKSQMWPSNLTLAVALTWYFQGQIWNSLYLDQKWSDCHERNKKQTWIELQASNVAIGSELGYDIDLEFSRSNMESTISRPKWSDCHETKNKHIDWTLSHKCSHRISALSLPWLNFQDQIWNFLYLSQRLFGCHKMKVRI